MKPTKVLSIKQPWASLICTPREDNPALGIKDIENRTWRTHFRGRVFVHASKNLASFNFTYQQHEFLHPIDTDVMEFHTSAIIGEVDIIDCVINHESIWAEKSFVDKATESNPDVEDGKPIWNWVLANPVLYEKPILNVKGKLSLWEPDDYLTECIACGQHLRLDDTVEDAGGNYYHEHCYKEMAPTMNAEYEEMKRKGEIE